MISLEEENNLDIERLNFYIDKNIDFLDLFSLKRYYRLEQEQSLKIDEVYKDLEYFSVRLKNL